MPREKNGQLAFFPIKPAGRPADKRDMSSQKPATTNQGDAMSSNTSQQDRDAARGNARIAKAEFIRERMCQEGCLAVEAARRWEAGER